jgi:hypothetical protein
MAKLGDTVFTNEHFLDDGESKTRICPGVVTAVVPTDAGYGKGHEFVTVTVFEPNGVTHSTELDKGETDDNGEWPVGTWSESEDGPANGAPVAAPADASVDNGTALSVEPEDSLPTTPPPGE